MSQAVNRKVLPVTDEEKDDGPQLARRGLLPFEKEKLAMWKETVDRAFEVHRRAAIIFERKNFFLQVLPTTVLSSAAAVLSLTSDILPQQPRDLTLACINALNTILIGVANYWKWPANAEKNEFAKNEYNALRERIMLLQNKIEMGGATFDQVLGEIELKMNEIRKQCGAPPLSIEQKYHNEHWLADYRKIKQLQKMKDGESPSRLGRLFRCLGRLCCACCSGKDDNRAQKNRAEQTYGARVLEAQLQRIGLHASNASDFKISYWNQMGLLIGRSDLQGCKELLDMVPITMDLVEVEPHKRSLLHLICYDGFVTLGTDILNHPGSRHEAHVIAAQLLWKDEDDHIPLKYMTPIQMQRLDFTILLIVKTFEALCFAHSGLAPPEMFDALDLVEAKCVLERALNGLKKTEKGRQRFNEDLKGVSWLGGTSTGWAAAPIKPHAPGPPGRGLSKSGQDKHILGQAENQEIRSLLHIAAEYSATEPMMMLLKVGYPLLLKADMATLSPMFALESVAHGPAPQALFRLLARALVDVGSKNQKNGDVLAVGSRETQREVCDHLKRGWMELFEPSEKLAQESWWKKVASEAMAEKEASDGRGLLHDLSSCPLHFLSSFHLDRILPRLLLPTIEAGDGGAIRRPLVQIMIDNKGILPLDIEMERSHPRVQMCKYFLANLIHTNREQTAVSKWRDMFKKRKLQGGQHSEEDQSVADDAQDDASKGVQLESAAKFMLRVSMQTCKSDPYSLLHHAARMAAKEMVISIQETFIEFIKEKSEDLNTPA